MIGPIDCDSWQWRLLSSSFDSTAAGVVLLARRSPIKKRGDSVETDGGESRLNDAINGVQTRGGFVIRPRPTGSIIS